MILRSDNVDSWYINYCLILDHLNIKARLANPDYYIESFVGNYRDGSISFCVQKKKEAIKEFQIKLSEIKSWRFDDAVHSVGGAS